MGPSAAGSLTQSCAKASPAPALTRTCSARGTLGATCVWCPADNHGHWRYTAPPAELAYRGLLWQEDAGLAFTQQRLRVRVTLFLTVQ